MPDVGAVPSTRKRATVSRTQADLFTATCPPPLRMSNGAPSCAASPRDQAMGVVGSKVLAITNVRATPDFSAVREAVGDGQDTHVTATASLKRMPEKRGATP